MADIHWWLFMVAALAVILTPGQDMIIVLTRSVAQGTRAGLATACGVCAGLLAHTALAAIGLGAIVQASTTLFWVIKAVGAAYLIFLGLRMMLGRYAPDQEPASALRHSAVRLFREGFVSNLANPKIVVFYIAFLPQFIPATSESVVLPLLTLGVLYSVMALVVKGSVALFTGRFSVWLRNNNRMLVWLQRGAGAVLTGLGARLAVAGAP